MMNIERKRVILHVDMDAFFAAVEQHRRPDLKGRPVVVGGDGNPFARGVVSAASYEARRYGIRSAMPLREAYRRCPEAVFLPVDFEEYARVSEKIFTILKEFSPLVEPVSLDEAFLDITDIEKPPEDIARDIKRRIVEETGLTASVGIGPNKLIAKIASDMNKPDGLTVIQEEAIRRVLFPLPASKLWGVGKKTEARLKAMGIETIGDLAKTPVDILTEVFGKVIGQSLHEHSLGIDDSPVVTTFARRSMSRETTYQKDTADMRIIRETITILSKDLAEALKEEGYRGRTVTLKIRYRDFTTTTRSKTLHEYIDSGDRIAEVALGLLSSFQWNKKVRLVGIRVTGLRVIDHPLSTHDL